MRICAVLFVAAILSASGSLLAGDAHECVSILNNSKRLACFDLAFAVSEKQADCREIEMLDLQLDLEALVGRCVSAKGEILLGAGDIKTISRLGTTFDQNAVYLKLDNLPKEDRREVLLCNTDCVASVTGNIVEVFGLPRLKVQKFKVLE